MRISLQLVVQDDGGAPATVTEIAQFERDGLDVGSLGLHLDEAKSLLGRLQRTMVTAQVAEAVARTSVCPTCGAQLACKGHHHLVFRSAFGRLSIDSLRLYRCRQCQGDAPTFSPVARCLPERGQFRTAVSRGEVCSVDVVWSDRQRTAESIATRSRRSGARSPCSVDGWKRSRPPMPRSRRRWRPAFARPRSRSPVRFVRSALTAAFFGGLDIGAARTAGLR